MNSPRYLAALSLLPVLSLLPATAQAQEEWHINIPATFPFYDQEHSTANLRLDPALVAAGLEVQYEVELENARNEISVALDAFNNTRATDITFNLAATGTGPWVENTGVGDLWGNPADWGAGGPTLRVMIQGCVTGCTTGLPEGNGSGFRVDFNIRASAAIWVWDPAANAWAFPNHLSDPAQLPGYAVLVLNRGNFPDPAGNPLDSKMPSADIIAHEVGHALGFEEQRLRTDALYSVLESPTAIPNVFRANSPAFRGGVFRLGAYAQGFLREYYPALLSVRKDDWVIHDAVLRRDPTQPLDNPDRVVGLSIFQVPEIAPQFLIWGGTTQQYLECQTHEIPRFHAQVSDVGGAGSVFEPCPASVDLEYRIGGFNGAGDITVGDENITHPCDEAYNEYQFLNYVSFDDGDVISAGYVAPPTATGTPLAIDFAIAINPNGAASEWNPDDNEVRLNGDKALVLFPSDTQDPRCKTQAGEAPGGPDPGARLGRAIATNKRDPRFDQYSVIGMHLADVSGGIDAGSVVVNAFRGTSSADKTGTHVGDAVTGYPIQVDSPGALGGEQFGASVAIGDIGTRFIVGAPGADNDDGKVYVCDTATTYDCATVIQPIVAGAAGRFGQAVALSPNGRMLAIGEPDYLGGRVYVYVNDGTGTFVQRYTRVFLGGTRYGAAIAANNDWLVAGDPTDSGHADVIVTDWESYDDGGSLLGTSFDLSAMVSLSAGDSFGFSVSVHAKVLVVGAPGTNDEDGAAYVFGQPHGDMTVLSPVVGYSYVDDWRLVQSLALVSTPGARYGISVDNYRGNVIIGATHYDSINPVTPTDVGGAFIYRSRKNEDWRLHKLIRGKDAFDRMGRGVALGGMFWLAGEPFSNRDAMNNLVGINVGRYRRGPYRTLGWYW